MVVGVVVAAIETVVVVVAVASVVVVVVVAEAWVAEREADCELFSRDSLLSSSAILFVFFFFDFLL